MPNPSAADAGTISQVASLWPLLNSDSEKIVRSQKSHTATQFCAAATGCVIGWSIRKLSESLSLLSNMGLIKHLASGHLQQES